MHEVLVNRLGGLSLPRKSVVRLTDRPDMTLDVYRGRKTTMQQQLLSTLPLTWNTENIVAIHGENTSDSSIASLDLMVTGQKKKLEQLQN